MVYSEFPRTKRVTGAPPRAASAEMRTQRTLIYCLFLGDLEHTEKTNPLVLVAWMRQRHRRVGLPDVVNLGLRI